MGCSYERNFCNVSPLPCKYSLEIDIPKSRPVYFRGGHFCHVAQSVRRLTPLYILTPGPDSQSFITHIVLSLLEYHTTYPTFSACPTPFAHEAVPCQPDPTRSGSKSWLSPRRFGVVDLTNPTRCGNPLIFDGHETCVSQTS